MFKRRPPKLLEDAFVHFSQGIEILFQHLRDKSFMPEEKDLEQFRRAQEICRHNAGAADYILRCMEQRQRGEPEGAAKFTDCEVFDWHYPR